MAQTVEIRDHREDLVAKISFDESPTRLHAQKTLAGFHFQFPVKCTIRYVRKGEPVPVIANLRGDLTAVNGSSFVEVGVVKAEDEISGFWSDDGRGDADRSFSLHWRGSFSELAAFEKLRAGRAPQFQLWLRGELAYIYKLDGVARLIRSQPESLRTPSGSVTFGYPAETWVRALRDISVAENVIVEIPLPSSPPAPWDEVWQFLVKARESFERGGSTGWEGCVVAVRQALERWEKIEAPQVGPPVPKQRSKAQRIDNLRVALHSCTHVWVHGQSPQCSRDEAVLMLSTLSALLAERNP
jgi:hypothetical protein